MTSSDNTPAPNIPTCIEWKGDSFASSRPKQPPTLTVSVEILQHVHQRFGKKFSLPQTHTEIEADQTKIPTYILNQNQPPHSRDNGHTTQHHWDSLPQH